MSHIRRLLVPGLSTLIMLMILVALGTWQMQRLHWKTELLAQIAAAELAPAIPLPAAPAPFTKVRITGRLRGDLTALYGAEVRDSRQGPQLGAQLIAPLERPGAEPVLVDLGWVPSERLQPMPLPDGTITVEGYVRPGDQPGAFSATDDAAARRFFTLDPQAIGAALGLRKVAPFTLVAIGPTPPGGYPDPARHLPRPPNNHLQYAITWYSLAVVLLVIFVAHTCKGTVHVRRV